MCEGRRESAAGGGPKLRHPGPMSPARYGVSIVSYSLFRSIFRPRFLRVGGSPWVGLGAPRVEAVLRVPQPVAGTVGPQDMHPMGQGIQQGAGQPLRAED